MLREGGSNVTSSSHDFASRQRHGSNVHSPNRNSVEADELGYSIVRFDALRLRVNFSKQQIALAQLYTVVPVSSISYLSPDCKISDGLYAQVDSGFDCLSAYKEHRLFYYDIAHMCGHL